MTEPTSVVWFRDDLRVHDNPALHEAVERGGPIVCLYVLDEESPRIRPLGGASRWWLHHSLEALASSLAELGLSLTLRRGPAEEVVSEVVDETSASAVFWNRRYGEPEREVDAALKSALRERGIEVKSFQGSLLHEPWTVLTGQGTPYRVFTPFYRSCLAQQAPRLPLPAPHDGLHHRRLPSDELSGWRLLPTHPDWAGGLRERWAPGEESARATLSEWLESGGAGDYADEHDLPAEDSTSHLSPHLRWGEISPFEVWRAVSQRRSRHRAEAEGATGYLRQIIWREFGYHLLFHYPQITTENLRTEFDRFPWEPADDDRLRPWRTGRTGIPLVDAGMRELWTTGYMHNRVRLVTGSFLVKNLRIHWKTGEEWFWDTLVDADPASNALNWQWVAGSGPDAAPYFRVFNPELQATKFDPHGEYVRRWVPERGTDDYPAPIVDLAESRRAALDAYATIR
ncbi:DNA photolyase family protein [Cnuibacter physcomitrellae]|uniref:cryptochrome/photolyase family protein n=1 Tax=Cnuibacter physcomitrellae TaxID=1619308 RepID=UPI002175A255|nr:deoxyribodipyrimidine photo-lyase [Cnuibacter physcomitrellae]MCS5495730.1 DNA photolyase family protein [Cnuibacter physcomitrellae]